MAQPLSRRSFLVLAGGTVGSALIARQTATAAKQPPVSAGNGGLDLDLVAERTRLSIPGGPSHGLTYNGQLPGPPLELEAGDAVQIRLHNRLDSATNLHFHGLHISPSGNADNVFLSVPPGASQTYRFTLPDDHPAGTFYYHPHHHGNVSDQVFGGLGGAIVVRGALDRIPEVAAAAEQLLVLKDLAAATGVGSAGMARALGREGSVLTVNGQRNPNLSVAAGGLLRLRLLNASNARVWRLALEGHALHLIASDGGALEAPVQLPELLLAPGERAEVLVRGNQPPGSYRLLDLPYSRTRGGMGMGRGMGMGMGRGMGMGMGSEAPARAASSEAAAPVVLATLRYAGSVEPVPLPGRLGVVEPLPEPSISRRFVLNHGMAPGQACPWPGDGVSDQRQGL